jgi:hypothetical protein
MYCFSQSYVQQQKKLDAKKQEALRGVLEKALAHSFKPNEPQCFHAVKAFHGMPGKMCPRENYLKQKALYS